MFERDPCRDPTSGGGQFDVSATGTLVYLSGAGRRQWTMSWLDQTGKAEPIVAKPGMYYSPRFSLDGRKLAYAVEAGNGSNIFVDDFVRRTTTRLTFTQQGNIEPVWTPDGKYIAYRSIQPPAMCLFLDLTPDAKRFAVFVNQTPVTDSTGTVHVTFLLHFFDELRRRVPATGK